MAEEKKVVKVKPIQKVQEETTPIADEKATKKPIFKQWWLWVLVALVIGGIVFAIVNRNKEPEEPAEKVYVTENQMDDVFANPEDYSGYYIKLSGKVWTSPEKNGDKYMMRAVRNPENDDGLFYVETEELPNNIKEDDFIVVDGLLGGYVTDENSLGNEVQLPLVIKADVKKSDYIEVNAPTIKELPVNATKEERGFSITVEKIQYAEKETRVFLKVNNDTANTMEFYDDGAMLLIDGQQIQQSSMESVYEGGLPELPEEYRASTTSTGTLIFPAIDQNKAFQLVIPDIMNDVFDSDYEFQDMVFDINPVSEPKEETTTSSTMATTSGVKDVEVAKGQDGVWHALKDGKIVVDYTGVVRNQNGNWYIEDGNVAFDFTGYVTIDNTRYKVDGGKVVGQESAY